jgi:hypothetical protein
MPSHPSVVQPAGKPDIFFAKRLYPYRWVNQEIHLSDAAPGNMLQVFLGPT